MLEAKPESEDATYLPDVRSAEERYDMLHAAIRQAAGDDCFERQTQMLRSASVLRTRRIATLVAMATGGLIFLAINVFAPIDENPRPRIISAAVLATAAWAAALVATFLTRRRKERGLITVARLASVVPMPPFPRATFHYRVDGAFIEVVTNLPTTRLLPIERNGFVFIAADPERPRSFSFLDAFAQSHAEFKRMRSTGEGFHTERNDLGTALAAAGTRASFRPETEDRL